MVSLETALADRGFQLNQTITNLYETIGNIEGESAGTDIWGNPQMSYPYRPRSDCH